MESTGDVFLGEHAWPKPPGGQGSISKAAVCILCILEPKNHVVQRQSLLTIGKQKPAGRTTISSDSDLPGSCNDNIFLCQEYQSKVPLPWAIGEIPGMHRQAEFVSLLIGANVLVKAECCFLCHHLVLLTLPPTQAPLTWSLNYPSICTPILFVSTFTVYEFSHLGWKVLWKLDWIEKHQTTDQKT